MCLAGLLSLLSLHSTHLTISFILPTGTACSSSYSNQEIRPALLPTSTLTSLTDLEQASSLSLVSSHHTSLLMAKSTLTQLSLQLLVSLPLPKPHAPVTNYIGAHGFATFINNDAGLAPSSTAYLPLLPSFPLRTRVLRSAAAGQRLQEGGAGAMPCGAMTQL